MNLVDNRLLGLLLLLQPVMQADQKKQSCTLSEVTNAFKLLEKTNSRIAQLKEAQKRLEAELKKIEQRLPDDSFAILREVKSLRQDLEQQRHEAVSELHKVVRNSYKRQIN